jgi:hypothetical protein
MEKKKVTYPNLRAEMARTGETQISISKLLGIAKETTCRKITGNAEWRAKEIDILCKYFNKTYEELFK